MGEAWQSLQVLGKDLKEGRGCLVYIEERNGRGASAQGMCLACSENSQAGQMANGQYVGYKTKEIGGAQSIRGGVKTLAFTQQ